MRALVIGAGPSGLIALKELREAGIACEAVDAGPRIGGAFDIERPGAPVYESTRLTTSNYFTAYGCFPPPLTEPRRFWTHREYIDYLRRFVRTFGLAAHIRFGTRITGIAPEGQSVRVSIARGGESSEARYDAVVVASGINQRPFVPPIPGLEAFDGAVVHARDYRDAAPFAGQRVLCVGFGETGADVAHEVARVASDAMLSTRHVPVIVERYPNGGVHPGDALSARCLHRLDPHTRSLRFMRLHRGIFEHADDPYDRLLAEWNVRTAGRHGFWLTKNEAPVRDIAEGRLGLNVSGIDRVEGGEVVFRDGDRFACDTLIFSTGYVFDWPCPSVPFCDVRDLYQMMLHPDLGSRVAFIGWVRPDLGGVPVCAELQARYLALLLTGQRALPSPQQMRAHAQETRRELEAAFCNAVDPPTVVHYSSYTDGLARLIGCDPFDGGRVRDPALLARLWFGSQIGAQYRLVGPGAQTDTARRTIMRLPIAWRRRTMVRFGARAVLDRLPLISSVLSTLDRQRLEATAKDFVAAHGGAVAETGPGRH